jgi:glycosyltransferase involved in cell wall biosynthesis
MMSEAAPALSVVVPAYNEQEVLPEFHRRLAEALVAIGMEWEVVYVNDGSRDTTLSVMTGLQAADPRVAIVNLSRNFGKEIALTAGLDHARGSEAIVVIDARPCRTRPS